ncbi:MAG TPA: right-handed parallel beta-helix repeat-containing protein, partial [Polyangiaceae bacterium]|nr:right-handed parallel beta-helix repeat-containing protein [Polyangiaceae bacterium]
MGPFVRASSRRRSLLLARRAFWTAACGLAACTGHSAPTGPSASGGATSLDGSGGQWADEISGGAAGDGPGSGGGGTGSGGEGVGGGPANPGTGGDVAVVDPDAMIVAPLGTNDASGTVDEPLSLAAALARVAAGQTIYMRGGTYQLEDPQLLNAQGAESAPILLSTFPSDSLRARLDFSAMAEDSANRGLVLSGSYWHLYGLDVLGAGDNGLYVSGSYNVVEFSTFSECRDTGLQLGSGAAHNLILNCDSYFNADSSLENADGFAAKLDVGSDNAFVGCRAWNNLDDGWDGYLRPADDVTTTYERCWAVDNGKLKDGSVGQGDGNGFKTGGSDDKTLRHNATYTQCIAAGNVHDGFDHNSNRGRVTIINSAAHDNESNINFSSTNSAASLVIKNSTSLGSNGSLQATATDIMSNSWQDGR